MSYLDEERGGSLSEYSVMLYIFEARLDCSFRDVVRIRIGLDNIRNKDKKQFLLCK